MKIRYPHIAAKHGQRSSFFAFRVWRFAFGVSRFAISPANALDGWTKENSLLEVNICLWN